MLINIHWLVCIDWLTDDNQLLSVKQILNTVR